MDYITINEIILFATFLALLWYANETKKIRQIEQEPIIDLYYRPHSSADGKLRLRNSGKGTAYNIRVGKITSENGKNFEFYFDDPNLILINNAEQTLIVGSDKKNDKDMHGFLQYVKQKSFESRKDILNKKQEIIIAIYYENIKKKKFRRYFTIYNRHFAGIDKSFKKEIEIECIK